MATSTNADRRRRVPLTRARVIEGAMALADRDGVGALTMRALASELGVKPMAVYHHVAGKEEILDGIVDEVFARIELPPPGASLARRDPRPRGVRPGSSSAATPGRPPSWTHAPAPVRPRCASTMP